jgi:hypothetical protein
MIRIEPASPPLQALVRCYVENHGDCRTHSIIQPVARTAPVIEFTFGDLYIVQIRAQSESERAYGVAVVGAQTHRRVDLTLQGSSSKPSSSCFNRVGCPDCSRFPPIS